ncbi:MAG: hypothetical protein ACREK1_09570, partial [Longimicrobiales bacterium]
MMQPSASSRALFVRLVALVGLLAATAAAPSQAQTANSAGEGTDTTWAADPPSLRALVDFGRGQSDLRVAVERYAADGAALRRRYDVPLSPVLQQRQREFYQSWLRRLQELDFEALNHEGKVDYV